MKKFLSYFLIVLAVCLFGCSAPSATSVTQGGSNAGGPSGGGGGSTPGLPDILFTQWTGYDDDYTYVIFIKPNRDGVYADLNIYSRSHINPSQSLRSSDSKNPSITVDNQAGTLEMSGIVEHHIDDGNYNPSPEEMNFKLKLIIDPNWLEGTLDLEVEDNQQSINPPLSKSVKMKKYSG